ncbi:hypothetical protein NA57DRAFT_54614 [Rhizodiscina lignyota]|uniref:Uncharacterized protein n=1 Tax=Rhizodiscina lignyota TaxID=1504668 RepID=A0A9P4IIE2_9PEZI|nr:hypothetical protein NA57DRAFT_54614 [Rhizodiscina lignyota]
MQSRANARHGVLVAACSWGVASRGCGGGSEVNWTRDSGRMGRRRHKVLGASRGKACAGSLELGAEGQAENGGLLAPTHTHTTHAKKDPAKIIIIAPRSPATSSAAIRFNSARPGARDLADIRQNSSLGVLMPSLPPSHPHPAHILSAGRCSMLSPTRPKLFNEASPSERPATADELEEEACLSPLAHSHAWSKRLHRALCPSSRSSGRHSLSSPSCSCPRSPLPSQTGVRARMLRDFAQPRSPRPREVTRLFSRLLSPPQISWGRRRNCTSSTVTPTPDFSRRLGQLESQALAQTAATSTKHHTDSPVHFSMMLS